MKLLTKYLTCQARIPQVLFAIQRNYSSYKEGKLKCNNASWEPMIGLEIHAQIKSSSKLFSGAENKFRSPPNALVSNFDASMPGTLPVLNKICVKMAVTSALALNCNINKISHFDRKHYFYADMPQGYQITQQRQPIAVNGYLQYPTLDGSQMKKVNIEQIQLEQDSGKSLHEEGEVSFIDLNRAGVGLMEIVTAPDLTNADDAIGFVKELYSTLKCVGSCEGKMSEGQFRVDANISIRTQEGAPGTRTEVKNISGFKHIHKVIEYEIRRQTRILEQGGFIEQETRAFDLDNNITVSMRDKEVMQDYRFMPEPNLPPLHLYDDNTITDIPPQQVCEAINIDDLRRQLPPLPTNIRQSLIETYKLTFQQAIFLVEREMDKYFLSVMSYAPQLPSLLVWEWIRIHLIAQMTENNLSTIDECFVTADQLADLLLLQHNLEINEDKASVAFIQAFADRKSPVEIVEENDWKMISDEVTVTQLCEEAIKNLEDGNMRLFSKYEVGNPKCKPNKKIVQQIIKQLHDNDKKVHTKLAKNVILILLDNKLRK